MCAICLCFILVIEVAIGEYGTDVLTKLSDSMLSNNPCYDRSNNTISGDLHDPALQLENGK